MQGEKLQGAALASELRYQQKVLKQKEDTCLPQQRLIQELSKKRSHLVNTKRFFKYGFIISAILSFNDIYKNQFMIPDFLNLEGLLTRYLNIPFDRMLPMPISSLIYRYLADDTLPMMIIYFIVNGLICTGICYLVGKRRLPAKIKSIDQQIKNAKDKIDTASLLAFTRIQGQHHPEFKLPNQSSWYYGRLAQLIETGQANNIGSAVKLLETRLQNEKLGRKVDEATRAARDAEKAARDAEAAANDATAAAYFSSDHHDHYYY